MVKNKVHYLNNLKSLLAILIIVCHVNMAYGGVGGWYYVELTNDYNSTFILTMVNAVFQSFAMGLFFFIAVYFTPKSYDEKGFYIFIKNRI